MFAQRKSTTALLLALLVLAGRAAFAADAAQPKEGTFSGSWAVSGTATPSTVGGAKVTVAHIEGKVTLESAEGLSREFDAVCNSVSDPKTGGVGRCVWTDAKGDTLTLELSGKVLGPAGTVRAAHGTVVGGSGRYAGIEGSFDVDWLFVESTAGDSKFKGYVTKLKGSWKRS